LQSKWKLKPSGPEGYGTNLQSKWKLEPSEPEGIRHKLAIKMEAGACLVWSKRSPAAAAVAAAQVQVFLKTSGTQKVCVECCADALIDLCGLILETWGLPAPFS
jgi:hypothetical protein